MLACHGADDPFVKPDEVAAFQDEMAKGAVKNKFVAYPGSVHSFTNPPTRILRRVKRWRQLLVPSQS